MSLPLDHTAVEHTAVEYTAVEYAVEVDVVEELSDVEASHPERELDEPVTGWQFDPAETEEYATRLHSLLGAVETLEDGPGNGPCSS